MQHSEKLSGSGSTFPNCPRSWGPEDWKYATIGICHPGNKEEVSGYRSAQAPYHPRDNDWYDAGVANQKDAVMLCASSAMSFFGFIVWLRVVHRESRFNLTEDLAHGDVRVNSYQDPLPETNTFTAAIRYCRI